LQVEVDKIKVIDKLPIGSVADVVVTVQEPWFMQVARRHNVWFPSGGLEYGLNPSKHVAYYETASKENENPKQIAYIAKNRVMWNRVTLDDAQQLEELRHLFADSAVANEIASWYEADDTFHIALTEPPAKLRRPIPLGKEMNYARILSKRRYSLIQFVNARTVDDLFEHRSL